MKQNKILKVSSVIVILVAIFINFNDFLIGNTSNWLNILTSISYILFWYMFILVMKNDRKSLIYSLVWSFLTFISALPILITNIKIMTLDWAIPMSLIFITPLYGIEGVFNQSGFLFVSIVTLIISFTWITISLFSLNDVIQ